jgi:hypothetical protein
MLSNVVKKKIKLLLLVFYGLHELLSLTLNKKKMQNEMTGNNKPKRNKDGQH